MDEIETSLKKHKDLASNFERFILKQFEDNELEQMFSDFMTSNPLIYSQYANLAMQYNTYQGMEDDEN